MAAILNICQDLFSVRTNYRRYPIRWWSFWIWQVGPMFGKDNLKIIPNTLMNVYKFFSPKWPWIMGKSDLGLATCSFKKYNDGKGINKCENIYLYKSHCIKKVTSERCKRTCDKGSFWHQKSFVLIFLFLSYVQY